MKTYIFEAVQKEGRPLNHGKFMIGIPDVEWTRVSAVNPSAGGFPLLQLCGWTPEHVWVFDLQTGEAAMFNPASYGVARADLEKHRIWVCPLFEEFLKWFYRQDTETLHRLPPLVELPDAQFAMRGYRRLGPTDVAFAIHSRSVFRIQWGGENRTVICESLTEEGGALVRGLTEEESARLAEEMEVDDLEQFFAAAPEGKEPEAEASSEKDEADASQDEVLTEAISTVPGDTKLVGTVPGEGNPDGS